MHTSRPAYLELRGTKRNHEGLVRQSRPQCRQSGVILTNAWWLDQIAATLHRTRTFLYAPDEPAAARALALLEAALDRTCFRLWAVREIPLRAMRLAPAHCNNGR